MLMDGNSTEKQSTILLVEDQEMILENIREELEDNSFKVLTASCARDACRIIDMHGCTIAAAFLDIDLGPGEDGFCVARYARGANDQIPVIYTSGGVRGALMSERVSSSLFVAKPYRPSEVRALLRDMLANCGRQPA